MNRREVTAQTGEGMAEQTTAELHKFLDRDRRHEIESSWCRLKFPDTRILKVKSASAVFVLRTYRDMINSYMKVSHFRSPDGES